MVKFYLFLLFKYILDSDGLWREVSKGKKTLLNWQVKKDRHFDFKVFKLNLQKGGDKPPTKVEDDLMMCHVVWSCGMIWIYLLAIAA